MKKIYTIHNNMNLQWFIMVLAIKLRVPKVIFLTFESGDFSSAQVITNLNPFQVLNFSLQIVFSQTHCQHI